MSDSDATSTSPAASAPAARTSSLAGPAPGSQPRATSWAEVVRLRTLPAALAPVILGAGAVAATGTLSLPRTLLAAGVALALQIGSNLANDYSDGVRGTDDDRTGPPRLTASGQVAPVVVKYAAFGCFALAGVLGLILVALCGQWWMVSVGVAAVAAAWFYTGGSHPYGYAGLGEMFVFLFFGLVATCGTVYVQTLAVPGFAWLAACGVGFIACALLMVNNLRDIHTDPAHGKRTLAVRLGEKNARKAFLWLIWLPVTIGAGSLGWLAAMTDDDAAAGEVNGVGGRRVVTDGVAGAGHDLSGASGVIPGVLAAVVIGIVVVLLAVVAWRVSGPVRRGVSGRALIPVLRDTGVYELAYSVLMVAAMLALTLLR